MIDIKIENDNANINFNQFKGKIEAMKIAENRIFEDEKFNYKINVTIEKSKKKEKNEKTNKGCLM
jgi:hypothetical protein